MFFVLRDTCIVSHGIDFVTFFGLGSDEKRASQISDTARIVTKFVTKNYVFVTEYILWSTLADDCIFVTRTSQNAKHNENNHFCDINRTSPKVKSLVVCGRMLNCNCELDGCYVMLNVGLDAIVNWKLYQLSVMYILNVESSACVVWCVSLNFCACVVKVMEDAEG